MRTFFIASLNKRKGNCRNRSSHIIALCLPQRSLPDSRTGRRRLPRVSRALHARDTEVIDKGLNSRESSLGLVLHKIRATNTKSPNYGTETPPRPAKKKKKKPLVLVQRISESKVARSLRETAALNRLTIEEEYGVEKQVQRSCRTRPGSDHQSAIAPSRQRRSSPLSPGLRIGNLGSNLDEKNSTIIFSSVQLRAWLAITLLE